MAKAEMEGSLYAGAIATGIVSLLPYVNVFIFPAYVLGALVAVWFAVRQGGQILQYKDGAKLGFLSTFLGSMVAVLLVDLLWIFLDYQLWQRQNSALLLAIFRFFAKPVTVDMMRDAFAQQAAKPFQWYVLIFQLLGNAIFCGLFGTLFGVLGVKIFRPQRSLGVA
ncbi:MAG TPA: hypothetical protein VGF73_12330 [Chthoniobacterales bacterium]